MPKSNRLCLALVSVAAMVSLAGVAEASRRNGRPSSSQGTPAVDPQAIVDRATICINRSVIKFNDEGEELIEDLAELASRVTNNTPESRILEFQAEWQEELAEEQAKAAFKMERVVTCATNKLTALGADPSFAAAVAAARDAAQLQIDTAAADLLLQLDTAVQAALLIAAEPDDPGTNPGGGCSDDDDDDEDEDDDDNSGGSSGRGRGR